MPKFASLGHLGAGRGLSLASCGDVEANPGPESGPSFGADGLRSIELTLDWARCSDLFDVRECTTFENGPCGSSRTFSMWTSSRCVLCSTHFYTQDAGPLLAHTQSCPVIVHSSGIPPANVFRGHLESCPDTLRRRIPISNGASQPVSLGRQKSGNRTGRGDAILSHGDVESNPGPQSTPINAPLTRGEATSAADTGGGLLGRLVERHSQPSVIGTDADIPMDDAQLPAEGAAITMPVFCCPFSCGAGPWKTRVSLFRHVERGHDLADEGAASTLAPWAASAGRRLCSSCRRLVPVRSKCPTCHSPPLETLPPSATAGSVSLDPWDDSMWSALFCRSQAILRSVPPGALENWYAGLAQCLQALTPSGPADASLRFAAFVRIVLAPVGRGGRRHSKQAAAVVNARLARWASGQQLALLQEHLAISLSGSAPASSDANGLPESTRRAALRAVREGALSKAARLLSEVCHPLPNDCRPALERLHPRADNPSCPEGPFPMGEDFTVDEVLSCIRSFPPGSSGGYSGLMASHLQGPESPGFLLVAQHIARIASDFAWGRFGAESASTLAGARLIAIGKTGGGVRPIAIGELFRRIAGKLLVQRYQPDASRILLPHQIGVGVRSAAEGLIHKVDSWMQRAPPDHGLLQLDFSNAYNTLSRTQMLKAVATHCPLFYHYADACYGNAATLFGPGFTVEGEQGIHQGCPCGPLFFAVSTLSLAAATFLGPRHLEPLVPGRWLRVWPGFAVA